MREFDFGGWATKFGIRCSDGRTIKHNAFDNNDGETVPMVWNHVHDDPAMVMGHALLTSTPEGVYASCSFNDSEKGKLGKELVKHGDVTSLSIWANELQSRGNEVVHGNIREVSLVLAGANPGAVINNVVSHGVELDDEAEIYLGGGISMSNHFTDEDNGTPMIHSDEPNKENHDKTTGSTESTESTETIETVEDVVNSMTDKQKKVLYYILSEIEKREKNGGKTMKHNAFEGNNDENSTEYLSHNEQQGIIMEAAESGGRSLKSVLKDHDVTLAHSEAATYGMEHIDYLFPDARTTSATPDFIKRDTSWVDDLMKSVHHTPFSRIKSLHANITEDDARALGYIKGKKKKEEVFPLLKRVTTPQTVYKKQRLDRDDIIDITDFSVVAWLKTEMRTMLLEEIARALLVGDGRSSVSEDKISEEHIRPVWKDDDLYTIKYDIKTAKEETDPDVLANAFIEGCIRARKNYKGSGNPRLYTTEDVLTNCLLLKDKNGRFIYANKEQLASTLRVSRIISVPVMENQTREKTGTYHELLGLILNPADYSVGADKGGSVDMMDDFDIDFNQMVYLMETRCSGAMTKPYGAIAIERTINNPSLAASETTMVG